MSTPTGSRREDPKRQFIQDRSNREELARLVLQDKLFTASMGGTLTEQPDPKIFRSVLDVACGTGGWVLECAQAYPTISFLIGIDVRSNMVAYARAQASAQLLTKRVEFQVMDALRMLEFPNNFFDLVNLRLGASFVRTWEWPRLLSEMQRVTRADGVIRITENNLVLKSNSPALSRLFAMALEAIHKAGHLFTLDEAGITSELPGLMDQYGIKKVQTYNHPLEYRAGTLQCQLLYEDMKHLFRALQPYLRKRILMPDDYEQIYQHALIEMQQPGFVATWRLLTAWGLSA